MEYDVCVVGLGPVGAVSAACYAKQGHRVIAIDSNPARLAAFQSGHADFTEPGLDDLLRELAPTGRLNFTNNLAAAVTHTRLIMVAIGTPTAESGAPDLSGIIAFTQSLAPLLRPGTTICLRSTVPPGTLRGQIAPLLSERSGLTCGHDFHLAANPEFLRQGRAIHDFFAAGRIVIGSDDAHVASAIAGLYREVSGERITTSIETAEFSKYVDNAWHALKVSFTNEVARTALAFGGSFEDTAAIFLADEKLNLSRHYLHPGFAFGGSCLPKDTRGFCHLTEQLGVNTPVLHAILPSNDDHIAQAVAMVLATGACTVAMLGLAFKSTVSTVIESPALRIAAQLITHGITILAHDQHCRADALPAGIALSSLDAMRDQAECLLLFHRTTIYTDFIATQTIPVIDLTRPVQLRSKQP